MEEEYKWIAEPTLRSRADGWLSIRAKSVCNKQTVSTITSTANDSVDARELAAGGLRCEHCQKELPKGYFVHTTITELK